MQRVSWLRGLNFATLALSMFAVSAVFVVLAYVRWRGVAQSERLAAPGRGNSVLLPTVAATICLFLALSDVTLLLYPYPNEVSNSEFYVMDSNRQTVANPTNLTQGTSSALILSITNRSRIGICTALAVGLNNITLYSFDNLTLSSGQNVERPIVVSFNSLGQKQKLQFTLTDSPNKTYELHLRANVSEPVQNSCLLRATQKNSYYLDNGADSSSFCGVFLPNVALGFRTYQVI